MRLKGHGEVTNRGAGEPVDRWKYVTPALVVVSGLIGAILTYAVDNKVADLSRRSKQDEIALEQQRFAAEQAHRKGQVLREYVPLLLNGSEEERTQARVMLTLLYPNDAASIFTTAAATLAEGDRASLEEAAAAAQEVDEKTGEWGVVAGSDQTEDAGLHEVELTREAGFSPVQLYLRRGIYATVITGFPREDDARSALVAVRARIRESAFVVNINEWCPDRRTEAAKTADEVIQCGS